MKSLRPVTEFIRALFITWTEIRVVVGLIFIAAVLPGKSATLLHRWSFTENGTDSVGGATAIITNSASFGPSELVLPGGGSFTNFARVNIANTLTNNPSLTVETWFTMSRVQNWSKVWMFGKDNAAGQPSLSFIDFTPYTKDTRPKLDFDTAAASTTLLATAPALLNAGQEYHVVSVYDAGADTMSMFIDGVLVISVPMGGADITQLSADTMRFGAGFYYADPDLSGSINEMRVYGGAVDSLQIAVNAKNGPDIADTNLVLSSLALHLASPSVTLGDLQDTWITYNIATYGTVDVTNSMGPAYSVSPSGIVRVDRSGRVTAIAPGVATVTATQAGKSSSATITVSDYSLALQHRYSFIDGSGTVAVDSVNPAGNGTLMGAASIVNNEVVMPGGTYSSDPGSAYVDLPNNIVSSLNSITIEAWVTDYGSPNWARIYDFGNSVGGEDMPGNAIAKSYMFMTAKRNTGEFSTEITQNGGTTDPSQMQLWPKTRLSISNKVHVAYSIDAVAETARLYVNGTQVDWDTNMTVRPKNLGSTVNDWLGRGQSNDQTFKGAIDEFRIWNRALSRVHLLASVAAGPDKVISNPTVQSVEVRLEKNSMLGGETQQASAFASFAEISSVSANAAVESWSSSNTNAVAVNSAGNVLAIGPGTATITAIIDGVAGVSAPITSALALPSISQQPVGTSNYVGGTVRFAVAALGGQLRYQWKQNGADLPDATNNILTLSGVTMANDNTVFKVAITNAMGGIESAEATLRVFPVRLAHRWSFDADANDSVGGVVCNLVGGATISGGSLNLPGTATASDYGDISGIAGTLNTTRDLTVEAWITPLTVIDNAKPWCFGNPTNSFAEFTVRNKAGKTELGFSASAAPDILANQTTANWSAGQEYHVVATFDALGNMIRLYKNGVLVDSSAMGGQLVSGLNTTAAYLGRSFWADRDFAGKINELRIYPAVLDPNRILLNYSAGPAVIDPVIKLSLIRTEAGMSISWPTGTLQASPTLTGGWTNVPSATSPYEAAVSSGQLFYRLVIP